MTDESYDFSTARTRLDDIVSQVRKKDTSLEKSLDLLEEGVRLANACTELIDHQDWTSTVGVDGEAMPGGADGTGGTGGTEGAQGGEGAAAPTSPAAETSPAGGVVLIEDVVIEDADGSLVAEVIEVAEFDSGDAFESADDAWADESPTEASDEADDPSAAER